MSRDRLGYAGNAAVLLKEPNGMCFEPWIKAQIA
jgi:hypothetical protein